MVALEVVEVDANVVVFSQTTKATPKRTRTMRGRIRRQKMESAKRSATMRRSRRSQRKLDEIHMCPGAQR